MTKNQLRAMMYVMAMALLALPAYLIIAVITIPIGIGMLMLGNSSPWILNLYPFLYAGRGPWNAPVYYLDNAASLPLTIVQWTLIAWAASMVLRNFERSKALLSALVLLLMVCTVTSVILSVMDIKLIWAAGHT